MLLLLELGLLLLQLLLQGRWATGGLGLPAKHFIYRLHRRECLLLSGEPATRASRGSSCLVGLRSATLRRSCL